MLVWNSLQKDAGEDIENNIFTFLIKTCPLFASQWTMNAGLYTTSCDHYPHYCH
ncbi:MAG: hypothetical protein ACXAEU_16745 [Candidatus Hodarchaeales archaeon]